MRRPSAGVVYQLNPAGQETVLHEFDGLTEGGNSCSQVIRDSAGNLFGLATDSLETKLYEIAAQGTFSILSSNPYSGIYAGIIQDAAGNFYGTNYFSDTVYKNEPSGAFSIVAGLAPTKTRYPESGVILDSHGNFYGTTSEGDPNGPLSAGAVY